MDKEQTKELWEFTRTNPFLFVFVVLAIGGVVWGFLHFIYNDRLDSKDATITELEATNKRLSTELDALEREQIKENINRGIANITITNQNIQNNVADIVLNASCTEKDIYLSELAQKVTDQDGALALCQSNTADLTKENNQLKEQIPAYETEFVGKDISVGKGGTFQADKGRFILGVINTEASGFTNAYRVTFSVNSIWYTKNLGEQVIFTHADGQNYTINVKSTGNPATFYVFKTE